MLFFLYEVFKKFSEKTHVFGRSAIFAIFLLKWGFELAPAGVNDHVKTSRDYIKVDIVKAWLLSANLARILTALIWMLF